MVEMSQPKKRERSFAEQAFADLRAARAKADLSQEEFAAELNQLLGRTLDQTEVSRRERGAIMPGADYYLAAMEVARVEGTATAKRMRALDRRTNLLLTGKAINHLTNPGLMRALTWCTGDPPEETWTVAEARQQLGYKSRHSVYSLIQKGAIQAYWWEGMIHVSARDVKKAQRERATAKRS
jgi:transcriptional regulator with XRE-family HTH domain